MEGGDRPLPKSQRSIVMNIYTKCRRGNAHLVGLDIFVSPLPPDSEYGEVWSRPGIGNWYTPSLHSLYLIQPGRSFVSLCNLARSILWLLLRPQVQVSCGLGIMMNMSCCSDVFFIAGTYVRLKIRLQCEIGVVKSQPTFEWVISM